MKRFILCIAAALLLVPAFAQPKNQPAKIRMEIAQCSFEEDKEFTLFSYKDDDLNYGYYFGLGHCDRIPGSIITFDQITETCLYMGQTLAETKERLEFLLALFNNKVTEGVEMPARRAIGEGLAENALSVIRYEKGLWGDKRLVAEFPYNDHINETFITKRAIKSMLSGLKFYMKLHPNEP